MKKVILVVAVMIAAVFTSNAQVFGGGTLGVDISVGSTTKDGTTDKLDAGFFVEFSPMVGFHLSEKMAIGAEASLGLGSITDREDKPEIQTIIGWGFAPFMRYTLVNSGNLSLLLHSNVGVNGMKEKSSYDGTTKDGHSYFNFGLQALPVLSYSLTSRLNIEARSNFIRFGVGVASMKLPGDKPRKWSDTYFGFGLNSSGPHELVDRYKLDLAVMSSPLVEFGLIFKF